MSAMACAQPGFVAALHRSTISTAFAGAHSRVPLSMARL
jgi:hypothetical protein